MSTATPGPDPDRPATPDDVGVVCGALPETELGVSWGDRPTWKVRGKGFLLYRAPGATALRPDGTPYDDLLVVQTAGPHEKQALVDDPDSPFFTVAHFDRSPAVLVSQARLGELTLAELTEVLTDAWASRAPATLVRQHLGDG